MIIIVDDDDDDGSIEYVIDRNITFGMNSNVAIFMDNKWLLRQNC
jgi:hypothetical protein